MKYTVEMSQKMATFFVAKDLGFKMANQLNGWKKNSHLVEAPTYFYDCRKKHSAMKFIERVQSIVAYQQGKLGLPLKNNDIYLRKG